MERERRRVTHKASPSENKATHLGVLPIAGVLMGLAFGVGCERVASMRDAFRDATAHEQYAQALRDGALGETALARDWRAAAGRALETPLTPRLPFREVGYFDPARPSAVGYRFPAQRGQELRIHVDFAPPDSARLFVDLFRGPADTTQSLTHVAGADTNGTLTVDVTRDASYLLRLQPELLRGGRYRLTIRTGASLAVFPVAGADSRAVQSVFGDPREGGAREHHGVDIFAPRGTPVVAVAEGVVGRVGDGGIGGKTVWLRDRDGRTFYYAHLDSQLVRSGKRVQPGDTLGLVGNTGNARTTPPHLHFGLYLRDPVDPYPYVHEPRTDAPPIAADTSRLGRFGRVAVARANLRGGPTTASPVQRVLPRHTALRLTGSSDNWHRVRLPDGTDGFVAASLLRPANTALRTASFARAPVRHRPDTTAAVTDRLDRAAVEVHGRFGRFVLIERPDGRTGWVRAKKG